MNAKFGRRLIAYLIDFIFIASILMILANFIPKSSNFDFLNQDMNALTEQAMNNEITFESYLREYTNYLREADKMNLLYNIISLIVIVIYYDIIPIFTIQFNKFTPIAKNSYYKKIIMGFTKYFLKDTK